MATGLAASGGDRAGRPATAQTAGTWLAVECPREWHWAPRGSGQRALRLLFAGVALLLCASPTTTRAKTLPNHEMVVTQVLRRVPAAPADWDPKGLVRRDWFEGARVVLVSPGGKVRVLSEGFESACDPDLSFDGQRLLFAGRKTRAARWRIWEVGLEGQGLRAVSPESMDARSPVHVSTLFTLDSPEPWFTMVFVGQEATLNELGRPSASSLYNLTLEGTELRRLTYNPNHNFDPLQLWDGRVVYAAERYPNQPGGGGGRVGLYAIHVEGADMELYGGELGARIQQMMCATAGGKILFVESNQATYDGAGQLACVEQRRPHVTYRRLTENPARVFLYPSPWHDQVVLVSRRAANGKGTCGVFSFNADTRACELVFDTPDYHEVQARIVQPRNRPDGHSTVVNPKFETGTFYGLNCYTSDPAREAHLPPGSIKRVRFIEGILSPAAAAPETPAGGPAISRRLIGEAPVEADGSFNVEVPADTPLLLQTLDERGLALGNCGWVWVKPKETRGCIGCHEDPERTPENEYVLALRRPSNRLVLPPAQRRSVAFREDIAPLLQRHCATADCHGGSETPLRLPLAAEKLTEAELRAAYTTLLAPLEGPAGGPLPQPGKYVDAGRARTSWLVWQLMGTNTARPWDPSERLAASPPRKVRQMPPPGQGAPLNEEALRTLVQWIDSGAQFQAFNHHEPSTASVQTHTP